MFARPYTPSTTHSIGGEGQRPDYPRRMREGYGTCSVINPRRMREGYGTWFVIRSFILSNELQRPSLTSETRSRYKQAQHDNGLQCDSWILLKCFRSRVMYGWLTLTAVLDLSDYKRAHS